MKRLIMYVVEWLVKTSTNFLKLLGSISKF
jgi:hypothetical protein